MNKRLKLQNIFIWSVRIILIFILGLVLIASFYGSTESFQNKIRQIINKDFKNSVSYEYTSLSIFPTVGLVLHDIKIEMPEINELKTESLKIHPRFLPLLTGNLKISKLTFKKPELLLNISKNQKENKKKLPPKKVIENINSVIKKINFYMPGLVTIVKNGRIIIKEDNRQITDIKKLNARISLTQQTVKIAVESDLEKWGNVSLVGKFYAKKDTIFIKNLSALLGKSSISNCFGKIKLNKKPHIEIKSGKTILILHELFKKASIYPFFSNIFNKVKNIEGIITIPLLSLSGPLEQPSKWNITGFASLEEIVYDSLDFPGSVKISRGHITAKDNKINLNNFEVSVIDTSFNISARLEKTIQTINSAEVNIEGYLGDDSINWISRKLNLPSEETLRAPLTISGIRILWEKGKIIKVIGQAAIKNGPTIFIDINKDTDLFAVNKLTISDDESKANILLKYSPRFIELSFKGNLKEQTLNRMFKKTSFHRGWIKGDFHSCIRFDKYTQSTAHGKLEGINFIIPLPLKEPLKVRHAVLKAENNIINIESASLIWGKNNLNANGYVKTTKAGVHFSADVKSDAIKVETIINNFKSYEKKKKKKTATIKTKKTALQGIIRLDTPSVSWGRYSAKSVHASIFINAREVNLTFKDARMCDIAIPGKIIFTKNKIKFDFQSYAEGNQLESALNCFFEKKLRITGKFDFKAQIDSIGKAKDLRRNTQGNVYFQAQNGVIHKLPLLAKIFAFLNVTELLRGKLPDFTAEGFSYNTINIRSNISQGVLVIKEAVIDGTTMQLVGEGTVDLVTNQVNLKVLVAPFKTVDFLISKIPVISYILKGTLISIPLSVTGDINNPKIGFLPTAAVGKGLLGVMKRTLMFPVKIIEPIIFQDKKEVKEN